MLLTLGISVISTILITLVLLSVTSRAVGVILLLDFWVNNWFSDFGWGWSITKLLFCHCFKYFFQVTWKSTFVFPSINSLINSFFLFSAIYLWVGVSAVSSCPCFDTSWVTEWSWMSCLDVSLSSSSSPSDVLPGFDKSLWSYTIASFLITDLNLFGGFIIISWVNIWCIIYCL